MPELTDVANEFIRERDRRVRRAPDERERLIAHVRRRPRREMQEIAAALIEGDHDTVDELTRAALDDGVARRSRSWTTA